MTKAGFVKNARQATCEFIEGDVPKGYKLDFEISLFNSQGHRDTQGRGHWISFHIVRKEKMVVLASVFFSIEGSAAISPRSAPFGSFELSEKISPSQLFDFITYIETRLQALGIKKVRIKGYPEQYHLSQHNAITVLLLNHGYLISNAELGACMSINEASFADRIDSWERRKLRQATQADLRFEPLPLKKLESVFHFINQCRQERGQSLSMSLTALSEVVADLSKYFLLFGVYHRREMVAASISIRVRKDILYNFYSAHSRQSDSLSPVVLLIQGIYEWCRDHRFRLLDLGTSALDGKPNFSLIEFKLRLGADPTMKLTYEKILK